jgi:hypothetical protein
VIRYAALAVPVAALALIAAAPSDQAAPQDPTAALREQLHKERQAWKVERRHLVRRARVRLSASSVQQAFALANVVYGVPVRGLSALAWCESNHTPSARNRTPLGGSHASGLTQILYPSTWRTTPYGHLSPFDPATSALAAGYIWRRAGGSFKEWADICATRGDRA